MALFRLPGTICTTMNAWGVDPGTLCRTASPTPNFSGSSPHSKNRHAVLSNKERLAAIEELTLAVGKADFYNRVARYDEMNAAQWSQMAVTQAVFARGESRYNAETKRYSASMRLTLHWGIVELFKDQGMLDSLQGHSWNSNTLFDWFLIGHVTAFRANGWMDEGVSQKAVAGNTRIRDYFNGNIPLMVMSAVKNFIQPDPYMTRGADIASGCACPTPAR